MGRDSQDFSAQNRAVIERKERERERLQLKAEASEVGFKKLIKAALKDDRTKQNISRDCLKGYKGGMRGELPGEYDPATGRLVPKDKGELVNVQADGEAGILDKSITGYEDRYWEED